MVAKDVPKNNSFLSTERLKPNEIYRRMKVQYGDACLSVQQVYRCTWKVHERHHFCNRLYRTGQAHRIVTPEGIAAVEAIVKEDGRVTVNGIAAHLDMSH